MKHARTCLRMTLSALAIATLGTTLLWRGATAQSSGGPYRIESSVVAAGGGHSAGAGFHVDATVGQSASATSAGGSYVIEAGFQHSRTDVTSDHIFANGFEI